MRPLFIVGFWPDIFRYVWPSSYSKVAFRSGKNCLVLVYSIHVLSVVSQNPVVVEVAESLLWYTVF